MLHTSTDVQNSSHRFIYAICEGLDFLPNRNYCVICLSKPPMSRPITNGVTGNRGKPSGVKKRKADDDLGSEQRLAKRFDLLNLGEIKPAGMTLRDRKGN